MVRTNFRNLNYRHFLSFKNGKLYYISGYNNSLISWMDVKDIMRQEGLPSIIPIDGGSSLLNPMRKELAIQPYFLRKVEMDRLMKTDSRRCFD
jgi:hypothetical protein